jgi:hypothetical protein
VQRLKALELKVIDDLRPEDAGLSGEDEEVHLLIDY